MIAVLCDINDIAASWICEQLAATCCVRLITAQELGSALHQTLKLGEGAPEVRIQCEGFELSSHGRSAIVNRLADVSWLAISQFVIGDQEYVAQELRAFAIAWLNAFPGPVLNRPKAGGINGQILHNFQWCYYAAQAGFAVCNDEWPDVLSRPIASDRSSLVVLDGIAYGAVLPNAVRAACRRLSDLVGLRLFGVSLANKGAGLVFEGGTTYPDLRLGGAALVSELGATLTRGAS